MLGIILLAMMSFVEMNLVQTNCSLGNQQDEPLMSGDECPNVTFVTRDEWGSSKVNKGRDLNSSVDYMFIHHTAMANCSNFATCSAMVRSIQRFHIQDRGWDDIGYNFLIGGDNRVYIGRDWGRIGAHTYMYNSVGYGIAFLGTFTDQLPSCSMMATAKQLIQCGVQQAYTKTDYGLYGHRDGRCTECPGNALYKVLPSWSRWHSRGPIKVYC